MSGKKLVIVESPAKARTLGKILGRAYTLKASLGHVRDLPRGQMGVDVDNNYVPRYVVPKVKTKLVNELKQAVKDASVIYLATDPDREGEAIAWHLAEVTGVTEYHRVVFREITEEAVKAAFKEPRQIDLKLVDAQQARRVLDRLVGYKMSPLLWKKVRKRLSAGRVQSVAVKIIVDREREILGFDAKEYWTIEVELSKPKDETAFRATLIGLAGGKKIQVANEAEASKLKKSLEEASYAVEKVATKKTNRQPAPPFTTSTLQQEAWRKLRFSAKQTMAVAQQLYEGLPLGDEGSAGLITYMRTDSTRVAESAIAESREYITGKYGAEYCPAKARLFTARARGSQDAHEAIRPTRIHREPSAIKKYLNASQAKLYELIWKRMVASQMAAAVFDNTTVDIEARNGNTYQLRTAASINVFPGFITLYSEGRDDDEEETGIKLPKLQKGDALKQLGVKSEQKFTQPPPRFTEATIVRALEQNGIGRPSTYAPIISTIQDREYIIKNKAVFQPTELGFAVNDFLTAHFPNIINVAFTARMESELDDIAASERDWHTVVDSFYGAFDQDLNKALETAERVEIKNEETGEPCPECGRPLVVKTGRFGKFVACSGYPECRHTESFQVKTGITCPECGKGELVQRVSKKKRKFYGCNRYPDCQFATNLKPIDKKCPRCGALLGQRGRQVMCTKCDYRGKAEAPDAAVPAGEV